MTQILCNVALHWPATCRQEKVTVQSSRGVFKCLILYITDPNTANTHMLTLPFLCLIPVNSQYEDQIKEGNLFQLLNLSCHAVWDTHVLVAKWLIWQQSTPPAQPAPRWPLGDHLDSPRRSPGRGSSTKGLLYLHWRPNIKNIQTS